MKKFYLLALLTIVMGGCDKPIKKPFIITFKASNYSDDDFKKGVAKYMYEDANGNTEFFTDLANKYNIGDTIK